MKAYTIDPEKQELQEIELDIQANTVYTFFNSISIDELTTLDKHTIHSDVEAIKKGRKPFFLGEQLIVGDALIFGKDGFLDVEVTIPKEDLASLINYDLSDFYLATLALLKDTEINLYSVFEVSKNDEDIQLNTEWVLDVFNIADDKTKNYFLNELQKATQKKENSLEFMQKMAVLAMNAMA